MVYRNIRYLHYIIKKNPNNCLSASYRFKATSSDCDQQHQKECPKDKSGRGFYYALGGVIIGTGAFVAYAKYDDEFRKYLKDNYPAADELVAFVAAEEAGHIDYIVKYLGIVKKKILGFIGTGDDKPEEEKGKTGVDCTKPPEYHPAKVDLPKVTLAPPPPLPPAPAAVIGKDPKAIKTAEDQAEKKANPPPEEPKDLVPMGDVIALEEAIRVASKAAIETFTDAICKLREFSAKVYRLVESSIENSDPKVWQQLKDTSTKKAKLLKEAEANAKDAMDKINVMRRCLTSPNFLASLDTAVKQKAKGNIDRMLDAVEEIKKQFEAERDKLSVTEKYWKKVQEARKHFTEELEILFPNVRLTDKNMKLANDDLDLFILYAFQNILFYQKELTKLDMVTQQKVKEALDRKDAKDKDMIKAAIDSEMESERRRIGLEFQKKMLMLRAECEKDMRIQMKRAEQAHADHLAEALVLKEAEMERKMNRALEEQSSLMRQQFKTELAILVGRLKGLDEVVKQRADQDRKAQASQVLWAACQALESSLRESGDATVPLNQKLRPLISEVNAIASAAAPGDDLVEAVIATIPSEAMYRGVFTDAALRDRFMNVERVAARVALLPEGGASMPVMLLSFIQSLLVLRPPITVKPNELACQKFDPQDLTTFDILQRARFWLDRGDFAQTLRYMNLLEGAPRAVALDWTRECRLFLEMQQAVQALMAHAAATGLVYS